MRTYPIILLLTLISASLSGQSENSCEVPITISISEVSMLDFYTTSKTIDSDNQPFSNNKAEQTVTPETGGQTWLNYSSIVKEGSTNFISASITSEIPVATEIRLTISLDAEEGAGATGTPSEELILSYYPQNIITNIGSCYTGSGFGKGHQLIYSWERTNSSDDFSPSDNQYRVEVTYTIASTE